MDAPALISLLARWAHILAAIVAVGGAIFIRLVAIPALDDLPSDEKARLHAAMRRRWSEVVAGAIFFLLASGLYNFILLSLRYTVPRWYHPVFGVKFLLALAVFTIASLLAGRTPVAEKMRTNLRFWLNLNIALAVLVVCLSGVLRTAERTPKTPPSETPRPAESPEGKQSGFQRALRQLI